MTCPTCDHTMHSLGARSLFWCPRCGTLAESRRDSDGEYTLAAPERPKLVERCREFEERLPLVTAGDGRCWHTLGIAESIHLPADRKPQ